MRRRKNKPGPGWKKLSSCVYERHGKLRIHTAGMLLYGDYYLNAAAWPEAPILESCVRLAGGNRRRGMMIWANRVIEQLHEREMKIMAGCGSEKSAAEEINKLPDHTPPHLTEAIKPSEGVELYRAVAEACGWDWLRNDRINVWVGLLSDAFAPDTDPVHLASACMAAPSGFLEECIVTLHPGRVHVHRHCGKTIENDPVEICRIIAGYKKDGDG